MHHHYDDITETLNIQLRALHEAEWTADSRRCPTKLAAGSGYTACTCVVEPKWWDEHGVPRYCEHSPASCPNIYADEVVLLLISCQACDREFKVQMSWSLTGVLRQVALAQRIGGLKRGTGSVGEEISKTKLSYGIATATESAPTLSFPHYGDPPHHDNCPAGPTMNCWDLRVLEFWSRAKHSADEVFKRAGHGYVRLSELEVPLPDLTSTDRVGPS